MAAGNGRSKSILRKQLSVRALREENKLAHNQLPEGVERPKTRGDCLPGGCNEQRPCPWVACKHHLYLDVNAETGTIKFNFPRVEVEDMDKLLDTCALDVGDRGGLVLGAVGLRMNLTRERVRQIETRALSNGKGEMRDRGIIDADELAGIERRNADHLAELRVSFARHSADRPSAVPVPSPAEQVRRGPIEVEDVIGEPEDPEEISDPEFEEIPLDVSAKLG